MWRLGEFPRGTVVYSCGTFDNMHYGHIRHLQEAAELGFSLVVGVTADSYVNRGPGRPLFNEVVRAECIAALDCVDHVFINHEKTAIGAIEEIRPDVYAKGIEYEGNEDEDLQMERELVESYGGRVVFTDTNLYSSSAIINESNPTHSEDAAEFLSEFTKEYSYDRLVEIIESFSDLRVLVVGDTILDRYTYVEPKERAPKTSMLSMKALDSELMAGGAIHVANHIAKFCSEVKLITAFGIDDRNYIRNNIEDKITLAAPFYPGPTILKHRFLNRITKDKLFEVCTYDESMSEEIGHKIHFLIKDYYKDYDMIVVADFGHGLISDYTAEYIGSLGVFTAVNVQCNSLNLGYNLVTKYRDMQYLTMDEQETRLATADRYSPIEDCIREVKASTNAGVVSMTHGAAGSFVHNYDTMATIPVMSSEVVDTIGAGDVFLAITSLAAKKGVSPEAIGFLGNAMAALAVRVVCTKQVVSKLDLLRFIKTLTK